MLKIAEKEESEKGGVVFKYKTRGRGLPMLILIFTSWIREIVLIRHRGVVSGTIPLLVALRREALFSLKLHSRLYN